MDLFLNSLIGFLTGVLSGFGIGGGTLLLLWLTLVRHTPQLQAGGVNLVYFIACALPALWGHITNGLVDFQAVLFCALAGAPACAAGALLASQMDASLLRRVFGGFILLIGLREVFHRSKDAEGDSQRSR